MGRVDARTCLNLNLRTVSYEEETGEFRRVLERIGRGRAGGWTISARSFRMSCGTILFFFLDSFSVGCDRVSQWPWLILGTVLMFDYRYLCFTSEMYLIPISP